MGIVDRYLLRQNICSVPIKNWSVSLQTGCPVLKLDSKYIYIYIYIHLSSDRLYKC